MASSTTGYPPTTWAAIRSRSRSRRPTTCATFSSACCGSSFPMTRDWMVCSPRSVLVPDLLDRHALREIAWLVDVGALEDRDVISQKLQRDGVYSRCLEVGHVFRHLDHRDAVARSHTGFRIGEYDQLTAAGADFHQVRLQFLEQVIVGGNGDHGHVSIHESQGAVLELPGRIGFGVDVGDFFQLQ